MKRYHVSRREDGCYEAKLENAERASKVCDTQAEAIDYAKEYSGNSSHGGVVHAERETENYSKGEIRDCVVIA